MYITMTGSVRGKEIADNIESSNDVDGDFIDVMANILQITGFDDDHNGIAESILEAIRRDESKLISAGEMINALHDAWSQVAS